MVWIQLFRTHCEIREVGLLSKCKWIQMVSASNILCITACLTRRQLATTKVDWERSSSCLTQHLHHTGPCWFCRRVKTRQEARSSGTRATDQRARPYQPSDFLSHRPSSSASSTESGGSRHVRRTARRRLPPSTSQFLTGGGREQTFRRCPSLTAPRRS